MRLNFGTSPCVGKTLVESYIIICFRKKQGGWLIEYLVFLPFRVMPKIYNSVYRLQSLSNVELSLCFWLCWDEQLSCAHSLHGENSEDSYWCQKPCVAHSLIPWWTQNFRDNQYSTRTVGDIMEKTKINPFRILLRVQVKAGMCYSHKRTDNPNLLLFSLLTNQFFLKSSLLLDKHQWNTLNFLCFWIALSLGKTPQSYLSQMPIL